ncbi:MAG: hypothetical protein N4A31_00435 [Rickettsiales bacterium]|jgi:hypothetical protein|nr:hypothetical protein [Rickettsiales bacterium]
MSELVCYVAIDDVFKKGEKSHVYKNINEKCLSQESKRISGDGPSDKKSGLVVGFNHYDKLVYKMHIEKLEPRQYSECDGPNATRGMFHYYETSEEILKSCKNNEHAIVGPMTTSAPITSDKIMADPINSGKIMADPINSETFDTDVLLGVKTSSASSLSEKFIAVNESACVSEEGFISSDIISYYNTWYLLPSFIITTIGVSIDIYYNSLIPEINNEIPQNNLGGLIELAPAA